MNEVFRNWSVEKNGCCIDDVERALKLPGTTRFKYWT
jgi:hypothetical protein